MNVKSRCWPRRHRRSQIAFFAAAFCFLTAVQTTQSCPEGSQLRGLGALRVWAFCDFDTERYARNKLPNNRAKAAAVFDAHTLTDAAARTLRREGIKKVITTDVDLRLPTLIIRVYEDHAEASLQEKVRARRAHSDEIVATTWSRRYPYGNTPIELIEGVAMEFARDYWAGARSSPSP